MTASGELPFKARVAASLREDRAKAQVAAKKLFEAGLTGKVGCFLYELNQLSSTMSGWPLAMRQIARLGSVSKEIQTEFALMWASGRHPPCNDCHAFLDAMRVLFPRYRGPAMRLFRGADAPEARRRKFFGVSWTSDIETARWFAKRYQDYSVGGVVFETMASREAIISTPGLDGPYFEDENGERMYDESEYLVDGRRLSSVKIVHRYPGSDVF
jgi:hypothetical protein